jgi:penicillin-binding protein 1A
VARTVTRKASRGRKKRPSRGLRRPLLVYGSLILAGLGILGVVAFATLVRLTEAELPPVPTFAEYEASVPKVSRILASDGTVVAEFFTERRTVIRPDDIAPVLEHALLAAEDSGFHTHAGLSYWGITRAMMVNAWRGEVRQGGSTITQQVAKQVLLSAERTIERKFKEFLAARLIEQKLTKREILAIYLSEVYLGHGRYGFEEASRYYFGKRTADLNAAEAALLAGLVSSPEANSPIRNPEGALARQHYVLGRMVEDGYLTADQAAAEARTQLRLLATEGGRVGAAPYFTDAVRREVTRLFGEGRLLHDGLTVETTLDLAASDAAEAAVSLGLAETFRHGRTRERDEDAAARGESPDDGTEEADGGLPPAPKAVRARIVRCDPNAFAIEVEAGGTHAVLDPLSLGRRILGGKPSVWSICTEGGELPVSLAGATRAMDGRQVPVVNAELGPQAAMVVLDPRDRGVLALVGGEAFAGRAFNRAVQSRRPIGSTVKPFVYAAALKAGMTPDTTFPNVAIRFRGSHGRSWTPKNYEGGYDGRDYSLTEALAKSINVIAVRVVATITPGPVADLLAAVGVDGQVPRDLSLALGSAESSPLALANAFAAFASGGLHDTPYLIRRVTDAEGNVLLRHEPRPSRQVPAPVAATLKTMMRRVVTDGTGRAAASLPVPAWGKTGTSNRSREAWFVGSDGRRVVSVLVGYDDRLPMAGATGGETAVPFFNLFVRSLPADR